MKSARGSSPGTNHLLVFIVVEERGRTNGIPGLTQTGTDRLSLLDRPHRIDRARPPFALLRMVQQLGGGSGRIPAHC